jgi:multiple sugar transport system ATP-binding protein
VAEVVFDGVTKVYDGGVEAVKSASLQVRDHEFLVLVGPSGCGKSTMLRMIAGLEEITRGKVSIGGRVVNDLAPKDRDIAMVFQDYALYPHMTVEENMSFALRLRKYPKAEIAERVREAAEILGLEELLDRRPRQLSGGQRQRVAVGRAIVRKPAVFLFDEPLSNLDAKLRVEMRAELKRLHARLKTTTVYVTHDQVEAMTLGERIAVLRDGVIQQVGRPLDLYESPVNRFVGSFLGTPPMNFMAGRLEPENDGYCFADGNLRLTLPAGASAELADCAGREVELGVRPEALEVVDAADTTNAFPAKVDVVEPLGHETIIYFRAGEQSMVGLIDAHVPVRPDQEVHLAAPARHLHVFDAESGRCLVKRENGQAHHRREDG